MRFQTFSTIIFSLSQIIYCDSNIVPSPNGTVFYYAYGSNLLAKRIHLQNPTAVFYGIAKLKDYRLDFNMYNEAWNGAVATIVEDDEEDVWGAVWTIGIDQLPNLDKQEGVDQGWYFAKNVSVTAPNGDQMVVRTYEETHNPDKLPNNTDLPPERRPSNTYLEVIALGAIECNFPPDYIGFLFSFPTNRKMATKERRDELGYPF